MGIFLGFAVPVIHPALICFITVTAHFRTAVQAKLRLLGWGILIQKFCVVIVKSLWRGFVVSQGCAAPAKGGWDSPPSLIPVSLPPLHLLLHNQLSSPFLFLWLVSAAVVILCEVLHCWSFFLHFTAPGSSPGDLPWRMLCRSLDSTQAVFAAQKVFIIKSKFL